MKRASPYTCDGCGIDKQPSNNWWLIRCHNDCAAPFLELLHWDDDEADAMVGVLHICGRDCAVKAISKWMGGGK